MNDIEKAIRHFKNVLSDNQVVLDRCIKEGVNPLVYSNRKSYHQLAISALEKQIPKRPLADDNGSVEYHECWLECPLCGEAIPEYTSENETECYCVGCGQKLEWGI